MQYIQEEVYRLINDMQNCSLTYNEASSTCDEIPDALHMNMNCVQKAKQT